MSRSLHGSSGVMTENAEVPAELSTALQSWLGDGWSAVQLTGDASVRVYYRVTAGDGTVCRLRGTCWCHAVCKGRPET